MSSGARIGIGGRTHMHRDLLVMTEGGQERDGDQAPLALSQTRSGPDRAPGPFGNKPLKVLVKRGLRHLGAIDMGIAQNRSANRHAGLKTVFFDVRQSRSPEERSR